MHTDHNIETPPRRRSAKGFVVRALAVAGGLGVSAFAISSYSSAAFSDTTDNTGNSLDAATVVLTDDDAGAALFTVDGMTPGDTVDNCIQVDYQGSAASDVKMYGSGAATLDPYLDVVVEVGTLATFGNCTSFTADNPLVPLFDGTLAEFYTAHSGWADGAAVWSPDGPAQKSLRITMTLQDDNDAQGKSATPTFTWEAQNQ